MYLNALSLRRNYDRHLKSDFNCHLLVEKKQWQGAVVVEVISDFTRLVNL